MSFPPDASSLNLSLSPSLMIRTHWKHDKFNCASPTANFAKWAKALKIHLSLLRLKSYVIAPLTKVLSVSNEPIANQNWVMNNDLAQAIILTMLDKSKYEGLDESKTAANLYAQVKAWADGEGPVRMISLIQEVLRIQCSPSESLTITGKWISDIIEHIFVICTLDKDLFKCVTLLNSLNSLQYKLIQAQISCGLTNVMEKTPYISENI
ncbi:hypothetical protein C0995_008308 [Termitomyces sp. Mi166|nr:hypothetical protein C0995_008308 [Termitomyces sp. Mi166\